jgi:2-isopropylmalate synthase
LRYEELGYSLDATELKAVYHRFTELADRKKRIYDQDLISLVETSVPKTPAVVSPGRDQWARRATA